MALSRRLCHFTKNKKIPLPLEMRRNEISLRPPHSGEESPKASEGLGVMGIRPHSDHVVPTGIWHTRSVVDPSKSNQVTLLLKNFSNGFPCHSEESSRPTRPPVYLPQLQPHWPPLFFLEDACRPPLQGPFACWALGSFLSHFLQATAKTSPQWRGLPSRPCVK